MRYLVLLSLLLPTLVLAGTTPHESRIELAREGRAIFDHTPQFASKYVGDALSCESCHLDKGRKAYAAPMWGAYTRYPRYQRKAGRMVTFAQRVRECFIFSEHGHAPPIHGHVVKALSAYAAYLTYRHGTPYGQYRFLVPTSYIAPRTGYVAPLKTTAGSVFAGRREFRSHCSTCHGADGQGRQIASRLYAPPLWGPRSFAQGAGMGNPSMAARFIWENMPYGHGRTLTPQTARNIADYVDSHGRPAPQQLIVALWNHKIARQH
ncbi:MAG: c-type cytochrome [Acidiferrobacterales bacterium]